MEIQDIIQGLTSAEIAAITSPEANTLIVNTTLQQAVIYVNGTFKQASFENTDDIPEGTKKFATTSNLDQINTNASDITSLQIGKEDAFTKNSAFNKNFGTSAGDVLQGDTRTITPTEISTIANQSGTNTGDETDASIKSKYENNPDTNAYTDAEKTKLSGLESSKFVGEFVSLSALQTAFPTAPIGSYAYVDTGVGQPVEKYIWDNNDSQWELQQGQSTAETPATIKTKYESNPDTNAFTDAEKTNLSNQSGTNTNDETTSTIQSKRPLKTIEGNTLEGSGNIDLDKADVGLGNVDNTSDADKPVSTATLNALNLKRNLTAQKNSIESDAGNLQLVNDEATPTANKYYGTDSSGNKGFHDMPYIKENLVITTVSSNFNSNVPTDIPDMTYTISGLSGARDFIFYATVLTNNDQNEELDLYIAKNGTTDTNQVIVETQRKNQDQSIQGTFELDGLVNGDVITFQFDTRNDNVDIETRRMIIQSWA